MQIIVYRNANEFCSEKKKIDYCPMYIDSFVSILKSIPAYVTVDICMCPLIFSLNWFNSLLFSN